MIDQQALQSKLWAIANELWGKMSPDEYRNYVLGFIFYKYLSEKVVAFANSLLTDEGVDFSYDTLDDNNPEHLPFIEAIKTNATHEVGYALSPNQLFHHMAIRAKAGDFILYDLASNLRAIEQSTLGTESADDFANLFSEVDLNSTKLGNTADDRNKLISKVLTHLDEIDFDLSNSESDVLGDAYEYMIAKFAAGAGKKRANFTRPKRCQPCLLGL